MLVTKILDFIIRLCGIAIIILGLVFIYLMALDFDIIGTVGTREYLGEIKDFDVSSGGFGSSTTCTILTTNDEKFVLTTLCRELRTGSHIYRQITYGWYGHVYSSYEVVDHA